ncbi:MAG: hypothetical protein ACPGYV_10100, partial [Phycisphaeraceae bacterium]
MTRAKTRAFRSGELSDLSRQLLYAPTTKRAEAVVNAERFHDEIEPGKNYPIDYVVYRLTDRRVPPSESVMLTGEALAPDLRLLIDALSRSIALPATGADAGRTMDAWAEELGVSLKTIERWRARGLRWRWGVCAGEDKPRLLIQRSAMEAFEAQRGGAVRAAGRFSRLTEAERAEAIRRARRLAEATNATPKAIFLHLAKRLSRSHETLRHLIARHDAADPEQAVFADRSTPLTAKDKRIIDRAYRRGVTVAALCRRFQKTRSTIYRAVHEARAQRILSQKIAYIHSPIYDRDDADEVLARPVTDSERGRQLDAGILADLPEALRPYYAQPVHSDRVLRSLVIRYHFLRYRMARMQQAMRGEVVRASDLDRFDEAERQANAVRGQIALGALPIVLSVVRRQLASDAAIDDTMSALDRGNRVLFEEIDRFDGSRSHTFESVLTNRL